MKNTIQFTYNKWFAYVTMILLSVLILVFIIRSNQLHDPVQIEILRYFEVFCFILLLFVFYKYFIPYLNKRPALELNEMGIIDYVRNRKVFWTNVQDLKLLSFRSGSSGIAIDLKDKDLFISDLNFLQKLLSWMSKFSFNTPLIIPLQYISGSKHEIFQAMQLYFKKIVIDK
jgi:hypothetical protein